MSKVLGQFAIVGAVFAIVIGASYPIVLKAQMDEQLNHYPDKMQLEENAAQRRYAMAEAHPENIQVYLQAGEELASVYIRQQKFDEAIAIYQKQLPLTWKVTPDGYNPQYNAINLKLAAIFRDRSDMKTALICYNSVLDLDRKYLPAQDPKIARDLNNIGLMHYLAGLGQEKDKDRNPEFQQAIDNIQQALAIINQHPECKGEKASALWNLYLAQRDIGNKAAALDCRKQAQAIDDSMHRVCRAP